MAESAASAIDKDLTTGGESKGKTDVLGISESFKGNSWVLKTSRFMCLLKMKKSLRAVRKLPKKNVQ